MTLKEKKFENYSALSDLLFRLETIIRDYNHDIRDMKQFGELMKRPIRFLFIREIDTLFDTFIHFNPGMAENTEKGYSITMIAPESMNESDPIKDVLRLNKVESIFWARDIVNKALFGLFPKEGLNHEVSVKQILITHPIVRS